MIRTTVKIEGMACEKCETNVSNAIKDAVPGAKNVTVSHEKGEASIVSEEAIDEEKLKKAIEEKGYKFISLETKAYKKRCCCKGK